MAANDGEHPVREIFPGIRLPDSTGAPGSATAGGQEPTGPEVGPVVGRPVISAPYGSSQLPENRPTLTVTSGDTSGMSSDSPVNESAFQGPAPDQMSTGAGGGSADAWKRYPWQNSRGGGR